MGSNKDRYDRLSKRMEESGALPVPILIVEDDNARVQQFSEWLPPIFRLVHCRTGGAALGLLARSDPWEFAGVMMDRDLDKQCTVNPYVDGEEVLEVVLRVLDSSTNILVHSANVVAAGRMTLRAAAQNPTTRVDYSVMTGGRFRTWLMDVWAEAVDRTDMFESHARKSFYRYACCVGSDWLVDQPLVTDWYDGKDGTVEAS